MTSRSARGVIATAVTLAATAASAGGGDTGTGAVGEMQLSGGTFALILAAMAGLGVVIWLVAKFAGK